MSDLEGLLEAIVRDPLSDDRWLVLSDWLEEHDDPRRAELLRLHRDTYPDYWRLSEACVSYAMLHGHLTATFGWRVHVGPGTRPTTPWSIRWPRT